LPAGAVPALATAAPATCSGPVGQYAAEGVPELLPRQIQLGGIAYRFSGIADRAESGSLVRIGCAAAFTVYESDAAPRANTLFLEVPEGAAAAGQATLFQFDAGLTFTVRAESPERPQLLTAGETSYSAGDTWVRSTFSSIDVVLYVASLEGVPDLIYAERVGGGAIGGYELATDSAATMAPELEEVAARAGLNPDLVVAGQRYILASVWLPVGTTTNGFVTLFGNQADPEGSQLLGLDPRVTGLFIYAQRG
jgi:hypothetical protein